MGKQSYDSGRIFGVQNDIGYNPNQDINKQKDQSSRQKEDDLIIEENTVYEIDRECYERLKRQKKHKVQDKRNI